MNKERNNRALGASYEEIAARFLSARGCRILCRNYRGRHGEIDLVVLAEDGGTLGFVEVKYRKSERFGMPAEAVTKGKQERIRQAAHQYLSEHALWDAAVRFDVVEILGDKIRVITNAFTA